MLIVDAEVAGRSGAGGRPAVPVAAVEAGPGWWEVPLPGGGPAHVVVPPAPPPTPSIAARRSGADTAAVLGELTGTGPRATTTC